MPNDRTREAARQFSDRVAGESGVIDYAPRPQSGLRNTQNTESDEEEAATTSYNADETSMFLGLQPARSNRDSNGRDPFNENTAPFRQAESGESASSASNADSGSTSESVSNGDSTPPTSTSTEAIHVSPTSIGWHTPSELRRLDDNGINQVLRRARAFQEISADLRLHDREVSNDPILRANQDRASRHVLNRVRAVVSSFPGPSFPRSSHQSTNYRHEQQLPSIEGGNAREGSVEEQTRDRRRRRRILRQEARRRQQAERTAAENRRRSQELMEAHLGSGVQLR